MSGVGVVSCRSWVTATPRTISRFGVSVDTGLAAVLAPAGAVAVDVAVGTLVLKEVDVGMGVEVDVEPLVD
jgi:hypothetical protein